MKFCKEHGLTALAIIVSFSAMVVSFNHLRAGPDESAFVYRIQDFVDRVTNVRYKNKTLRHEPESIPKLIEWRNVKASEYDCYRKTFTTAERTLKTTVCVRNTRVAQDVILSVKTGWLQPWNKKLLADYAHDHGDVFGHFYDFGTGRFMVGYTRELNDAEKQYVRNH